MAVHGGSHYHRATELFSWATLDLEVMEYGAATTSKPVFKPPTMACFSFFSDSLSYFICHFVWDVKLK